VPFLSMSIVRSAGTDGTGAIVLVGVGGRDVTWEEVVTVAVGAGARGVFVDAGMLVILGVGRADWMLQAMTASIKARMGRLILSFIWYSFVSGHQRCPGGTVGGGVKLAFPIFVDPCQGPAGETA
jgi:hypothetical protein